jgi:hypothetical protein
MLKVKLKESALVNVNKNRCSLQINTLRCCKLIYTIVKVRNVNAVSVSVTSGNRPTGGDRAGKLLVVQQKIHLFSATNYTANLYSICDYFANTGTNLGQDCP